MLYNVWLPKVPFLKPCSIISWVYFSFIGTKNYPEFQRENPTNHPDSNMSFELLEASIKYMEYFYKTANNSSLFPILDKRNFKVLVSWGKWQKYTLENCLFSQAKILTLVMLQSNLDNCKDKSFLLLISMVSRPGGVNLPARSKIYIQNWKIIFWLG